MEIKSITREQSAAIHIDKILSCPHIIGPEMLVEYFLE